MLHRPLTIENAFLLILNDILSRREKNEKVGMWHIVYEMKNHDNETVREYGQLIETKIEYSVLELLLSNGEVDGLIHTFYVNMAEKI